VVKISRARTIVRSRDEITVVFKNRGDWYRKKGWYSKLK